MRAVVAIAVLSTSYAVVCLSCAAGNEDDDIPTGPVTSASSGTGASGTGGAASTATSSATATGTGTTTGTTTATTTATTTTDASSTDAVSTSSGMCAVYGHTIAIDGVNDFAPNETFATSSANYTGFVAWDAMNVYLGMRGADVASGSSTKFFVVYLGTGAAGSTEGISYNTQQPTLPFPASFHFRWKTDTILSNVLEHDGVDWFNAGLPAGMSIFHSGDFLELSIPRAELGNPSTLDLVLGMLNEQGGVEGTYAGVPSSTYADGYDPNFIRRYAFDLEGCDAPATYVAL